MHTKLEPPAVWKLTKIPGLDGYKWQMIQDPDDAALPIGERPVYKREWFDRSEFEKWMRERYRINFVREVLKKWPGHESVLEIIKEKNLQKLPEHIRQAEWSSRMPSGGSY